MSQPVVLNTRAREQAAELSSLLQAAGFEAVEAPAIAIVSAWDAAELDAARRGLSSGAFDWVVLPSQNAARGLESQLAGSRVVCGTATAEALGIEPRVALDRFSAAAALDALTPFAAPGQRVLVPRAAEGRDELIGGLRALGFLIDTPVAYRTVAAPDAAARLRFGGIDVLTLCSPSAARSVASAVQPGVRVVCLGQTTADAVRELGLRVDAVAEKTSMESLVAAVENAIGARAA